MTRTDVRHQHWVPVNVSGNTEAIASRLQKAFPEVTRLFPAITVGVEAGQSWRHVVDAYAARLSRQRLDNLFLEVDDLFSMGWTDEQQFELVVTSIFGLDAEQVHQTSDSAWRFVATLEEHLSVLRLSRHA
jgi:hypothetical protein